MKNPILCSSKAIEIAEIYRAKYQSTLEGKSLHYTLDSCKYIDVETSFSPHPIWNITFDVPGWDDIWYSVIISDLQKEVLCCSSAWQTIFSPHKKAVAK